MHVFVALICTTGPCLLCLAVLQYLENLRLQKSKPEIVMSHDLVAGSPQVIGRLDETFFGDEPIIERGGKLRGNHLVCDSKRPSDLAQT